MQSILSELTETVGEGNEGKAFEALGVTLNGEHIAQHAFVSGLLAVEVLVTGSLPAAMITQVGLHQHVLCCIAHCHLERFML